MCECMCEHMYVMIRVGVYNIIYYSSIQQKEYYYNTIIQSYNKEDYNNL